LHFIRCYCSSRWFLESGYISPDTLLKTSTFLTSMWSSKLVNCWASNCYIFIFHHKTHKSKCLWHCPLMMKLFSTVYWEELHFGIDVSVVTSWHNFFWLAQLIQTFANIFYQYINLSELKFCWTASNGDVNFPNIIHRMSKLKKIVESAKLPLLKLNCHTSFRSICLLLCNENMTERSSISFKIFHYEVCQIDDLNCC